MENLFLNHYIIVKHIHFTAAILSFSGFILRGFWMLKDSPLLQAKLTRVLPHIIDTILLATAIYLVMVSQLYPFAVNWVTAKVFLLIAYIIIGTIALKRGKTKSIRLLALVTSLIIISTIFAIALIKPALNFW